MHASQLRLSRRHAHCKTPKVASLTYRKERTSNHPHPCVGMESWPQESKDTDAAHGLAARSMIVGINQRLVEIFGPTAGTALGYYVDPRMAPDSPLQYQRNLRLFLGPASQGVIGKLRDMMCEISGSKPKAECRDLSRCLDCISRSLTGAELAHTGNGFADYVGRFQCGRSRFSPEVASCGT